MPHDDNATVLLTFSEPPEDLSGDEATQVDLTLPPVAPLTWRAWWAIAGTTSVIVGLVLTVAQVVLTRLDRIPIEPFVR